MATWHRYKGPAFVAGFLRSIQSRGLEAPVEIDGVRLIDTVRAMRQVVLEEGSPVLQKDVLENENDFFALAEEPALLPMVFGGSESAQ